MISSPSLPETARPSGLTDAEIGQFKTLIGSQFCLTGATEIAPYCQEPRNKFFGKSALVLKPGTTREISDVVKLANALNVAIVPQGGNSGWSGDRPRTHLVIKSFCRWSDSIISVASTQIAAW